MNEYVEETTEYLQWLVSGRGAPDGGYPAVVVDAARETLRDAEIL